MLFASGGLRESLTVVRQLSTRRGVQGSSFRSTGASRLRACFWLCGLSAHDPGRRITGWKRFTRGLLDRVQLGLVFLVFLRNGCTHLFSPEPKINIDIEKDRDQPHPDEDANIVLESHLNTGPFLRQKIAEGHKTEDQGKPPPWVRAVYPKYGRSEAPITQSVTRLM